MRACVNAAHMPLSLKLPDGFSLRIEGAARPRSAAVGRDRVGALAEGLAFANG